MGIAVGDYENNGALDFYYSSIGEQILLRNRITEGFEEFRDVASRAGVSPPVGA